MNRRQAKKKRQYNILSHSVYTRFGFTPKGWSDIRWIIGWINHPKGVSK